MPASTSRSRAARGADEAERGATVTPINGDAAPAAETPAAKPTVGVHEYAKPFFKPLIDGVPVDCEHVAKYGHDSERAALACARKLAAGHGTAS